jgi:hypothetical protein
MLLTMKAPANRDKGQRTVRCNEAQANILRKVGWTEVEDERFFAEAVKSVAPVAEVVNYYVEELDAGSPNDVTLEPEPIADPDEVRPKPKRAYHRRNVKIDPDGKVNYSIKPPKRRYRRRDMTAED